MVRRSMQESRLQDDQFDPEMIHDIFTQAILDLKVWNILTSQIVIAIYSKYYFSNGLIKYSILL